MLFNRKIFFYSEESVTYVEARGYRLRFGAKIFVATVVGLMFLGVINQYNGDFLNIGFLTNSSLMSENTLLKQEIKLLNAKMNIFSDALNKLAESDNQLRTAVNLPKIDVETREMGTGGKSYEDYSGIISRDAGNLVNESKKLLESLEREIQFQKGSYGEIYKKSEQNKILFSSLPAIKPMVGSYSYHGFGVRRDPILGITRMHEGVDIHNDVGTPVYATGDGVVEFSGNTGSAYGIALEINHGFGYKTWYAHLSRTVLRSGQKVKRGTLIAYSGNTGRSTGPHLHYEVRYLGNKKNPVEFFVSDVDYDKIRTQLAKSDNLIK